MDLPVCCSPRSLHPAHRVLAAAAAVEINAANRPTPSGLDIGHLVHLPRVERIAVMTSKRWAPGTRLAVDFLESTPDDLAAAIIDRMNIWARNGVSVEFVRSKVDPVIRITREDSGYYSNVGTDCLLVPSDQPTMCFEGWTMSMPESEWDRVIPHEAGHALGSIHEHMRAGLVARIDPEKAIAYYWRDQGWSPDVVWSQILTPEDESSLIGTAPDETSGMCYDVPGACTYDGLPIIGGSRMNAQDFAFMRSVYPPVAQLAAVPVPRPAAMVA